MATENQNLSSETKNVTPLWIRAVRVVVTFIASFLISAVAAGIAEAEGSEEIESGGGVALLLFLVSFFVIGFLLTMFGPLRERKQ